MDEQRLVNTNFGGLIDTTLREGSQSRLFNLSIRQQIHVVKMLGKNGFNVDLMEVGIPSSPIIKKQIKQLSKVEHRPEMMVLVRNNHKDLLDAVELGIEGICILCSVDLNRLQTMNITFEQHLEEMTLILQTAHKLGLRTKVVVEDYFRQDRNLAHQIYKTAASQGVDRIAVPDTTGTAFEWDVKESVARIRKIVGNEVLIDLHFHNTVNTIFSGFEAGANFVDTSLLGIGERNGITPLSTAVYRLLLLNNKIVKTRYNLKMLTYIEQTYAEMLGIPVPHHLITSPLAFTHKAGIHLRAILNQGPESYEPIDPEIIGQSRTFIIGSPISGKTTETEILSRFPNANVVYDQNPSPAIIAKSYTFLAPKSLLLN